MMAGAGAEIYALAGFVAGALAGFGGALLRGNVGRAREGDRWGAPSAGASRQQPDAALRRLRAADRWRIRQARRRERRAQRLLSMACCLIGGDERGLAARGTRAAVDDFGAEWASLWHPTAAGPVLLGSAARRGAAGLPAGGPARLPAGGPARLPAGEPADGGPADGGPAAGGAVHCLPLRDDRRRTIGFLVVGFESPRGRRPLGLEAYAAFLGLLLAAELARSPAGTMVEETGARAA